MPRDPAQAEVYVAGSEPERAALLTVMHLLVMMGWSGASGVATQFVVPHHLFGGENGHRRKVILEMGCAERGLRRADALRGRFQTRRRHRAPGKLIVESA